ncbi:MAG: MerR family transcriptional regulator [Chloroflexi bacterium]|jgi:predicted site-specific integrase-resolvase|nr:MerR family transcriptional regulator [Chloroflexota bacterium]
MPKQIKGQTYYRTTEACNMAGISKATLFRWIKEGIMEDVGRKDRNGWRLFNEKYIAKIKAEATRVDRG